MTWDELMSLVHSADWKKSSSGLHRIRKMLEMLGNPQKGMAFIHVAGTNGKGSTCAMLSAVLTAAGYRTGLYISPHIFRVNERWCINGEEISDEELLSLAELLRPVITAMEDKPTAFEIVTAIGFLYFKRQNCDIVVLEVGMGGRLDATNVIEDPAVCAIMNIGLEHTEVLGDTIEKIAFEKAGIIKTGTDVVLYHQDPAAENVIRRCTEDRKAHLYITDPSQLSEVSFHLNEAGAGQTFSYRTRRSLSLSLPGQYQTRNAMAVLDVLDRLIEKDWNIPDDAVCAGLSKVRWPGRFELVSTDPMIIVDGAHNPNGVEALSESIRTCLAGKNITFVMGVMADKDYSEMLRILRDEAFTPLSANAISQAGINPASPAQAPDSEQALPAIRRFITEMPPNSRSLDQDILRNEILRRFSCPVETFSTVQEALLYAIDSVKKENDPNAVILAFGSLYQISDIMETLRHQ